MAFSTLQAIDETSAMSLRSIPVGFSSGNEFYDDGYTQSEIDAADLPSTHLKPAAAAAAATPSDSPAIEPTASQESRDEDRFFGRDKELQRLCDIHARVMANSSAHSVGDHQAAATAPSSAVPSTEDGAQASADKGPEDDELTQSSSLELTCNEADRRPIYPAVLVWGTSGTGKSMMVGHFLNRTCCTCGVRAHQHERTKRSCDDNGAHSKLPSTKNGNRSPHPRQSCSCCYVLRGKYDEYTGSSDPFSAIVQALDDFATQLRTGQPEELERIQRLVEDTFQTRAESETTHASRDAKFSNSAISTLIAVVPSLAVLLTQNSRRRGTNAGSSARANADTSVQDDAGGDTIQDLSRLIRENGSANMNTTSSWNRLRYIFLQFMNAISTPERPVYLFLDDLQWSSSAALELLATMIADPRLKNLMFIGAIRQETDLHNHLAMELSSDAPLRKYFLDVLSHKEQTQPVEMSLSITSSDAGSILLEDSRHLEQIMVDNFSAREVAEWLSNLFDRPCDDSDLQLLSNKIHKKTRGNLHFTLQAIEELKRMNILFFSRISFRWEWTLGEYARPGADLPVSDNIVAAIESQLKELPQDLQHILSVAAYIRSAFNLRLLLAVLRYIDEAGGIEWTYESSSIATNSHTDTSDPSKQKRASTMTSSWTMGRLSRILEQAVLENLVVNTIGESIYRFVHDRVQQAAQGLIPYGEIRDKLRTHIGHCLLGLHRRMDSSDNSVSEDGNGADSTVSTGTNGDSETGAPSHGSFLHKQQRDREHNNQSMTLSSHSATRRSRVSDTSKANQREGSSLLFIAADHLNSVPTKEHLFLVHLNVEVGERALEMAALAPAAMYLQRAGNALRKVRKPWKEHHDVCLRLFRSRSEVELSLGHFEMGYSLGHELIKQSQSLDEKLATCLSMANALGRQSRNAESLSLGLSVMRQIGGFPNRFYLFHIMRDLKKIKAFLKSKTNEQIINLPFQRDYQKVMTIQFTMQIGLRSFFAGDFTQWLLYLLKSVRLTMRHGICEESAMAFTVLGVFWNSTNEDHALVKRCVDISLRLLERTQGTKLAGWIYATSCFSIYSFNQPVEMSLDNHRKGYAIAMEAGEFEQGMMNQIIHDSMVFCTGDNLLKFIKVAEDTAQQCKTYNIMALHGTAAVLLANVRCLIGEQAIDWDELHNCSMRDLKKNPPSAADVTTLGQIYFNHAFLAAMFRKYKMAHRLATIFCELTKQNAGFSFVTIRGISMGLASAGMYRETKKRKYARELKAQIKVLESYIANRADNLNGLFRLLHAEQLSLRDTKSYHGAIHQTQEAYDIAIAVCERSSLTHFCAMACELAGEYLLRMLTTLSTTNNDDSKYRVQQRKAKLNNDIRKYMAQAIAFYTEWGCMAKVKDIKERRSEYLSQEPLNSDGHGTRSAKERQAAGLLGMGYDSQNPFSRQFGRDANAQTGTNVSPMIGSAITFNGNVPSVNVAGRLGNYVESDGVSVLSDL